MKTNIRVVLLKNCTRLREINEVVFNLCHETSPTFLITDFFSVNSYQGTKSGIHP